MADHLSERDDLTPRTLAFIERTTVAEIVRLMLASRRERQNGGGNVIRLERTRP